MKVLQKAKYAARANHFKGYAIHSPFIFGVVSDLIYAKHPFYSFGHLRDFYSHLSRTEKKLALSLKDAFRFFRLLNTLKPTHIKSFGVDRFDVFLLHQFRLKKRENDTTSKECVLIYLAGNEEGEWKQVSHNLASNDNCVWVVKNPNTLNKENWKQLISNSTVSSSITFYGLGVAFTDAVLPKKNFRIV